MDGTKNTSNPTVEVLARALRTAPIPARELTKKKMLLELVPELRKQLGRGHTVDSLSAVLTAKGLPVSGRALRALLTSASATHSAAANPAPEAPHFLRSAGPIPARRHGRLCACHFD